MIPKVDDPMLTSKSNSQSAKEQNKENIVKKKPTKINPRPSNIQAMTNQRINQASTKHQPSNVKR